MVADGSEEGEAFVAWSIALRQSRHMGSVWRPLERFLPLVAAESVGRRHLHRSLDPVRRVTVNNGFHYG
jgi:hypothetical protein